MLLLSSCASKPDIILPNCEQTVESYGECWECLARYVKVKTEYGLD